MNRSMLPRGVQQLVVRLSCLPGVGEKTAQRFALHLATNDPEAARSLGAALSALPDTIGACPLCGNLADTTEGQSSCTICRDPQRDRSLLCVVARIQDLLSIERSSAFRGCYFVLGCLLSPLEGISAADLPLAALEQRVREPEHPVREVLVATPPSVDGEATALLLAEQLKPLGVSVTRLASGVPHGGDLEFADPITIGRAIVGRRGLDK